MNTIRKRLERLAAPALVLIILVLTGVLASCDEFVQVLEEELAYQATVESEATPTRAASPTRESSPAPQSDFDFYVMVLSWSPDYCATDGNDDVQQCGLGKKLGFVLHGLWPQYDKGYPSNCSTQKLPEAIEAQFPGLYPSPKLYDHEWEKHGTCSGLQPEQYLALSKQLKESVTIPERYRSPAQPIRVTVKRLKEDFIAADPDLDKSGLAVFCSGSGRFLKELYVCFSTGGQPAPCSAEIHTKASKSCQNPDFLVRNVR